jgi:hypothetical protein
MPVELMAACLSGERETIAHESAYEVTGRERTEL